MHMVPVDFRGCTDSSAQVCWHERLQLRHIAICKMLGCEAFLSEEALAVFVVGKPVDIVEPITLASSSCGPSSASLTDESACRE